jgi:hypothetical protein
MFWSAVLDARKSPRSSNLTHEIAISPVRPHRLKDLLIRNRHLAHDPPRLPKDATKWSITQFHETQPLPISLLSLDLWTSHLAIMISFGAYSFNSTTLTLSLYAQDRWWTRLKQYTWPIHRLEDVKHSKSSQPESSKFSGNLLRPESSKRHEADSLSWPYSHLTRSTNLCQHRLPFLDSRL